MTASGSTKADLFRMSKAELVEKLEVLREQVYRPLARQRVEHLLKTDALYWETERLAKLGHWEWDEIRDRCIYCSEELARLHGVSVAEYLERASSLEADLEWVHPDDRQRYRSVTDDFREHRAGVEFEYRLLQPDGGYLDVRGAAAPILDEEGALVRSIGIIQDITECKRAERAIRQSQAETAEAQERLMQAIEACPEGFAWYDAEDRLVAFNKKYQEIYAESADLIRAGASFEDVIRQGAQRGQYPEATGRVETWIAERLEQHRGGRDALEQPLPDGRWVQISERRLPDGGVVGIRADITKLKQAEEALRESEECFKGVFDLGLVGMAILLPSGEFQQVNQAYCDFVGYDEHELVGGHYDKVIHPDDLEGVTTRLRRLLAGEIQNYHHERRYRHKEGFDIWGLAGLSVLRDSEGDPRSFVVQVLDISERKRAEEALRERETLLRQAVDMAGLGHWVWDDVEDRCVYCSETLARMSGITVADFYATYVTNSDFLEDVHPEDRQMYLQVLEAAAQEKRAYSTEFRELKSDGGIRYFREQGEPVLDANGRLVRTVGTLQDITEHRETEQALKAARDDLEQKVAERTEELRKNQAHLKAIMDHLPMQIGLKDTEGRYVLVNREFERRYGVENQEIIGKLPTAVFSEEVAGSVRDHDEAVLKSRQAIERIMTAEIDGEIHSFLAVKFPVLDEAGNITGIGAAATDITERTRAEEALRDRDARLREQQGQLEQFSRVSAMGQLSRTLAYDLGHPVTAMMNYCAAVRRLVQAEPRPDSERIVEIMDRAIGQAARIGQDVRDLRGLFETAERTTSPQDVNQIVEDALALALIDPAQVGALCRFESGRDLPSVSVSRLEIQQVVFNVIKNALEAVTQPETGEVTIQTTLNENGMVEVIVSDTGCGVPEEIKERMFRPFVTTKPNSLGLGLSIGQTIIEAYAGRLWYEPNPGGGTRVHFTLPSNK